LQSTRRRRHIVYVPKTIRLMDFMTEITVMLRTLRFDREPCVGKMQWSGKPAGQRPTSCNTLGSNIAYCMSGRRNALWFLIPESCNTLATPLRCAVSGQPSDETWLQPNSRRSNPDGPNSCSQKLAVIDTGALRSVDFFLFSCSRLKMWNCG